MHRTFLLFVVIGCAPEPPRPALDARPNFIVIDIDSLRADRLDATRDGALVAPTLHALAASGVSFTQAWSASGWTIPGITAILSGRHPLPPTLGGHEIVPVFRKGSRTLPEIFAAYDYQTHAVWRGGETDVFRSVPLFQSSRFGGEGTRDALVGDATAWLREAPRAPFFLWIHQYNLAHQEELNGRPGGTADGILRYDELLTHYDGAVADILAEVARAGLTESTVIVLTSDHGMDFGEHGEGLTVSNLYDSNLRVPLVVVDPKGTKGRVVTRMVSTIDIAPTLLERAGIPVDGVMDGLSLAPLLADPDAAWPEREIYSLINARTASLRTPGYKLILKHCGPSPHEDQRCDAYFDLTTDPGETRNLFHARPDLVAAPKERLAAWQEAQLQGADGWIGGAVGADAKRFFQEHGYWETMQPDSTPDAREPVPPPPGSPVLAPPLP